VDWAQHPGMRKHGGKTSCHRCGALPHSPAGAFLRSRACLLRWFPYPLHSNFADTFVNTIRPVLQSADSVI